MALLKKKKADGVDKKAEKKSKRKSNGGGNGVAKAKDFVVNHVEKIILGAIALVALLLVISGFTKDRIATGPDDVQSAISRAESQMQSDTWAQVKQERMPEDDRFKDRATLDSIALDSSAYGFGLPFHPRLQKPSKKRTDPALFAPIQIEVAAGYGGLKVKSDDSRLGPVISGSATPGRSIDSDQKQVGKVPMGGTYESRFFVAITGLIPYKKQFDAFQEAFQGAQDYNIDRDIPNYLFLEVQRAEVNADGTLGEWVTLDTNAVNEEMQMLWDGVGDEVVDPMYVMKNLSMPMPPIVRRDLSQWARHSTVPVLRRDDVINTERRRSNDSQRDLNELERIRRGDFERSTRMEDDRSADLSDEAKPELDVDNGMLRYVDLTAERGKAYKYRVHAVLEDPNNPQLEGRKRPPAEACETSVLVRLQKSEDPLIRTPWSEPSSTIVVPQGSQVFAAEVAQPRMVSVGNRRIPLARRAGDEPMIKLLALTWDAVDTRDVPIIVDVRRGSVLDGRIAEVEAIDPSANRILPLNNYEYSTGAMVLDIHGGKSLGDDLTAPASMLIWKDGKLEFRSELGDKDAYEMNDIPPDTELELERRDETDARNNEGTDDRRGRRRGNRRNRGGEGGRE